MLRIALLSLFAWAGCGPEPVSHAFDVPGRPDLAGQLFQVNVNAGLSDDIQFRLPPGLSSVLIEVHGPRGQYRPALFYTPSGANLVENGMFVTRDARWIPGLVDWLFPNSPTMQVMEGRYAMRLTALDSRGGSLDGVDQVEVRIYSHAASDSPTCRVHLDFMVASDVLDPSVLQPTVDALVAQMTTLYAQANITLDYTITPISVGSSALQFNGIQTKAAAMMQVQQALALAPASAVHIFIVSSVQLAGNPVKGYSLGLPGPFDADRPNAAVLIAADQFLSPTQPFNIPLMAVTCAHEAGHYLGLYHTSEENGVDHDPIPDTPECSSAGLLRCPDANNIMFYEGGVERNTFTQGQAVVMHRHPLCEPEPVGPGGDLCPGGCGAPTTCVLWGGTPQCRLACDPSGAPCAGGGPCVPSDDGTYVCG